MTDAITREEKLMEAIATGSPSNIKPITREEIFLAKAGGQDVETPEPITRREKLLQGIIDNGGGGSTGGDGDTNMLNALIDGSITEITTNAESVRTYAFYGCKNITNVNLPSATSVEGSAFENCTELTSIDLSSATSIGSSAFGGCKKMNVVILRSGTVCTLSNVSAFYNTPLRGRDGLTGTLYVPQALIEKYKTATNWSSIYAEGFCDFLPIEGSEYE